MEINELLLLVLIPFGAAVINLMMPSAVRKILTLISVIAASVLLYTFYNQPPEVFAYFGKRFLSLDKLGFFAAVFVQVLSFIILLFSLKGVDKETEKRFFFLFPLTIAFANGVIISEHALSFLIFWGLSGLTLYLFATLGTTHEAPQTAKKTFIIIGGSDAFLLLGFVIMWLISPGTKWSLLNPLIPLSGYYSHIAFVFLLIAAFAKAGGFPFHTWVPDYSKDAPVESVALLPASIDKLLGIFLLAKMVTSLFIVYELIHMIIITLGALTIITAVMMAMIQHNGRKLLGYHAVSQVGYMIMGVGSGNPIAFAGGLFHMINHTIYKSNLFLSLGSVEKKTKTNELDYLGGLGKVMPVTFLMAVVGALSISGIPPFNGFFSKWMIYQGMIEKTAELSSVYKLWMLACIILAVFGSALTLASFMKFLHAVFLGMRPKIYDEIKEAPFNQRLSLYLLSLLCITFGIFAVQIPLNYFIYPVLTQTGIELPQFIGLYEPGTILILFLTGFLISMFFFSLIKKVRYDEVYIGGMNADEKFRISGTEFYNEVRNFAVIKSIYNAAEKKYFDLYDLIKEFTFSFSGLLQKAHPGQLQLYTLYIAAGLIIMLILI